MVYDKRPRREGQTPSSYEQQTGSSSRNIYRSDKPSPIISELRQRWIDKRQAREEQEWFDSLPVLDPDGRGTSTDHNRIEKQKQTRGKRSQLFETSNRPESATEQQEKRRESAAQGITQGRQAEPESPESDASFGKPRNLEDSKNRKSQDQTEGKGKGKELEPKKSEREKRKRKKEQEQKKKKEKEGKGKGKVQGKKRGGWFSFFGAGKSPDKKLKPNKEPKVAPTQTNDSPSSAGSNHNSSTPGSSSDRSQTKLATEKNNAQSPKPDNANGGGSIGSADSTFPSGTAANSSSHSSTRLPELPNPPIFVAPNLDAVKQANPETVLGKTSGGGIIYISKNPTAEDVAVTQGTGIQKLSTSQSSDIYQQQRETAIEAIDSVKDRGQEAQLDLTSGSSGNIAQIESQIAGSVTQTQSAIAAQKAAVAKVMQTSRTSVTNQSDQTIKTISGQYNQTILGIDARTDAA